jgi:sugar-specific transcriptional regulator TrmB
MDISQQLKSLGLNRSEITIYLFLLENGISTPPVVSRGTKIARTNCYNIFQSLREKNLITKSSPAGKTSYMACDPESLLRNWERKKEALALLVPDLRSLYTIQKNKPKIQFFDGINQVFEIYQMSLKSKQVLAIGSTMQLQTRFPDFTTAYFKEVKKRGIVFNDILTYNSSSVAIQAKEMLKGLYEYKLLPEEHQDLPTDILIWENNIALITLEDPVFGTVLTNRLLSKTFHMIFNIMWGKSIVPRETIK